MSLSGAVGKAALALGVVVRVGDGLLDVQPASAIARARARIADRRSGVFTDLTVLKGM
jgi:hypothetical protein